MPKRLGSSLSIITFLVLCLLGSARRIHAQTITVGQNYCNSSSAPCVTSYHNDSNRDGVNPNETTLTASYVYGSGTSPLNVLKSVTTDGLIFAQPLYIHKLNSGGGTVGSCSATGGVNTVFVATQNDTVYAFDDSASTSPCWKTSLLGLDIAVPYNALPSIVNSSSVIQPCTNTVPEVGIMGTPVIDVNVTPPLLYVVAKTYDGTYFYDRLHVIDTFNGSEVASPLLGTTNPADRSSSLLSSYFNPQYQNQRAGLALFYESSTTTSDIYISWGSFCDSNEEPGVTTLTSTPYNGWLAEVAAAYSGGTLTVSLAGSFTTEPLPSSTTNQNGLWMGGAAPAVDLSGNVYLASSNAAPANGATEYGWNGTAGSSGEWAHSLLQISNNSSGVPIVTDFYTPNDWPQLNGGLTNENVCVLPGSLSCTTTLLSGDTDLGSGGVVLLSPTFSSSLAYPELIGAGKEGMIYTTWYNSTVNLHSGFNDFLGGLDNCGYGCTTTSNPQNTDCTPSTTGPSGGSPAQCWEGLNYSSGSNDLGSRGDPAFIGADNNSDNYLYTVGSGDILRAFQFTKLSTCTMSCIGTFGTTSYNPPMMQQHTFGYPGSAPSVTWNSAASSPFTTTVVWAMDNNQYGTIKYDPVTMTLVSHAASYAQLYAYSGDQGDGGGLGCSNGQLCLLWSDTTDGPDAVKFVVPTVVDSMLFAPGGNNDPPYKPGVSYTSGGHTTNCETPQISPAQAPTNCGMLVIYH
jgi:hypothetical protein